MADVRTVVRGLLLGRAYLDFFTILGTIHLSLNHILYR